MLFLNGSSLGNFLMMRHQAETPQGSGRNLSTVNLGPPQILRDKVVVNISDSMVKEQPLKKPNLILAQTIKVCRAKALPGLKHLQ